MAAPKEKRTMCSPDGNTIEIPHNAKGPKGATEGVCPEAPPPDPVPDPVNAEAERACRDVYQGTFIPPNQCDWYSTNSSTLLEDGRVLLTFNGHYLSQWDENNIMSSTLLSYEPVSCIDRLAGDLILDPSSSRCQIPLG